MSSSRTPAGSSQAKVHLSPCTPAGRGITIVSPSSATIVPCPEFSKPLTCCPSSVPVIAPPAAVVTAPQMATGQQPKVPVHVSSQMTVNQARNAVRTGGVGCGHGRRKPCFKPVNVVVCVCVCVVASSRVSQSGPAHRGGDPHPVCSHGHLSPTSGGVLAAALQSGARLHPGWSRNGLRRSLSYPAQRQRRFIGGRRSPDRRPCEQLGIQQRSSSGLQARQGHQGHWVFKLYQLC